jgi:hypothetical protein
MKKAVYGDVNHTAGKCFVCSDWLKVWRSRRKCSVGTYASVVSGFNCRGQALDKDTTEIEGILF